MAEYYPLLAKAIAGLPNATPEMRRGIYERARKALLAQLRTLEPPLAEADVARETEALDGAVARLEAELTALNGHAAEPPHVTKPAAPAPSAPGRPAPPFTAAARTLPPRRPIGPAPGQAPAQLSDPSASSPSLPASAKRARKDQPEIVEPNGRRKPEVQPTNSPKQPQKTTPSPQVAAGENQTSEVAETFDERSGPTPQKPRVEALRLYPPRQKSEEHGSGIWLWVIGGVVAVVVAIVAVAAWSLRDRPDMIAKLKPVASQPRNSGKIVERIGGPKPPAKSQAPAQAAASRPTTQAATPATSTNASAPKPAEATQTIPVAQRAALLVEAPNEPNKVKTYVGTVVWRLDNVSNGASQPLGTAVHADIDVPSDKMKVALTLQKNTDPSLPASHTITVVFTVQPDSPTGGIKQISVPQLRQDDAPTGDPLIGVPVPIMENSFLIGLTRGSAEATNLQLIKDRAWFDIPILLGNGHIAKLTFEKATSGTRAINEAIAAWQGQQ